MRSVDLPNELLLPRVAAGEDGSARACIERFGGLVWALARRHTPSTVDAEDAVQEIFVDLWKSAERYDPMRSTESGFVAMIARRRLIDLARRRATRAREAAAAEEVGDVSPAIDLDDRLEASRLRRALEQLPNDERSVLELVTFEGLSQQEVAQRLGLPLGTVKTIARRGLLRVRDSVGARERQREEVES